MTHRHDHVDPAELAPLDRYRRDVLSRIGPLDPIHAALLEAHGAHLAADAAALRDLPPFANSAMDGFAVRAADATAGARLRVAGEIAAGSSDLVGPREGQAVRIMTGAPIPEGADAVVPLELVTEEAGDIVLQTDVAVGDNVREAGESVRAGEVVLTAGRRLEAPEIGMLAALGIGRVSIHPQPRVAVLATGDELVEPGQPLQVGQIHESNSFMLTAQAREAGAVAFRQPIARDDREELTRAFEGALSQADLLVVSGGVSAGRYDLSKQVLAALGDVTFTKVGMQPGMPQAFGFIGDVPVFGLPGNPVSAAVSFEVFVRPAIRRLQGRRDLNRPRVTAVWDEAVVSPPHKVSFLRVTLRKDGHRWLARTTGAQGSGILRSLVDADGLAEVPAHRTDMQPGDEVVVHLLVDPG